jgi:hypothetical protein
MRHTREHMDRSSLHYNQEKIDGKNDSHPRCATTWYFGRPRLIGMSERQQIGWTIEAKEACRSDVYM